MPVDPCFAPILAGAAAPGDGAAPDDDAAPGAAGADPVAAARAATEAMFAHPSPPEVAVRDATVPSTAGEVPVRVYTPATGAGPWPVLVYCHGGGFIAGSVVSHDGTARELTAGAAVVTVSVDYRLAPEHPYPAALEDCAAALAWVQDHAADLDGDPGRVALGGDSAGGNLALGVALRARDQGRLGPACLVLVYPVVDPACDSPSMRANGTGYLLTADAMAGMWQAYLGGADPSSAPEVAPLRAATLAGLAPTLVITAEYDPLRDEGEALAAALGSDGVAVTRSRYGGQIHGFFSMYGLAPKARAATGEVVRFLGRALGH